MYNTIQIDNRCWMRENLRTTHYSNGESIPLGTQTLTEAAACRCYPNNDSTRDRTWLFSQRVCHDARTIAIICLIAMMHALVPLLSPATTTSATIWQCPRTPLPIKKTDTRCGACVISYIRTQIYTNLHEFTRITQIHTDYAEGLTEAN